MDELSEETMKICEYCFLEVLKLKDKCDQKETDSVIISIYNRWGKVRYQIVFCLKSSFFVNFRGGALSQLIQ